MAKEESLRVPAYPSRLDLSGKGCKFYDQASHRCVKGMAAETSACERCPEFPGW
ncbi:MAG: hypothetical protein K6F50_07135 [Kiritimatiellae bacterium]|nr:hypothetical protein [Kiritimatiellia bacterium]